MQCRRQSGISRGHRTNVTSGSASSDTDRGLHEHLDASAISSVLSAAKFNSWNVPMFAWFCPSEPRNCLFIRLVVRRGTDPARH
jgi:hypothetical protein